MALWNSGYKYAKSLSVFNAFYFRASFLTYAGLMVKLSDQKGSSARVWYYIDSFGWLKSSSSVVACKSKNAS